VEDLIGLEDVFGVPGEADWMDSQDSIAMPPADPLLSLEEIQDNGGMDFLLFITSKGIPS
jgi:hypothetical protein